jgi:hypothetical protein
MIDKIGKPEALRTFLTNISRFDRLCIFDTTLDITQIFAILESPDTPPEDALSTIMIILNANIINKGIIKRILWIKLFAGI